MPGLGGILGGIGKKLAPFLNGMGGEDGDTMPSQQMPTKRGGILGGVIPKLAMPEGEVASRQMPPITGLNMPARNEHPIDRAAVIGTNTPLARPASGIIPQMAMPKTMQQQPMDDGEIPVPSLPGRKEPTRGPFAKERFEYVYGRQPKDEETGLERKHTFKERLKSGILPALLGAVQGAAATPGNPLGGLLGGAATGFGAGAISPTLGREYEFDTMQLPSLVAEESRNRDLSQDEYRRQKQGLDIEGQQLGNERNRMAIEEIQRRAKRPIVGEASWGTYDTETGQPIWQRPQGSPSTAAPRRYNINGALVDESGNVLYQGQPKERQMTLSDAMAEETAAEGTVEQIAQDSLAGRLDSLRQKLPKQYQDALGNPDDMYYAEAQQAWDKLQSDELNKIRREVSERRRSNAGIRRKGGSRPAAGSQGGTAKLSDLKQLLK